MSLTDISRERFDKYPEQGECEKNLEGSGKPIFTRRRIAHYTERTTAFCAAIPPVDFAERVFLIGRPPGRRELLDMAGDSDVYLGDHYPIIKRDGQQITWAGTWFGEGDYTVADAQHVYETLRALIAEQWRGQDVTMLATPATTGRDLWVRLVPSGDGWPVLPRSTQTAIRSNAGQGRIQTFPGAGVVRLHEYDARLAYLSVTRRMPVGYPVELIDGDAAKWVADHPYQPARVQVSFRPPAGWGPVGILPVKLAGAGDAWCWPTEHAWHGPTWCESSELFVADRAGWQYKVHSVIGWERCEDVFRAWQDRLLAVLAAGQQVYALDPVRSAMLRAAVRSLVLHSIGAMHGAPHKVTHVGYDPGPDVKAVSMIDGGGRMVWNTSSEPAWPQLSHPEWTATIWGRWRARLLDGPAGTGALHVERGAVVAFRTDAIYTSRPVPEWADADDGKVGRFRLKTITPAVPWPRNGTDILAAKAAAL